MPYRVNKYIRVILVRVSYLDLFNISILKSDFLLFRRALDKIIVIFKAFDRYLKSFRISYYDIRPVFDNFKITYLLIREDSYIEAKTLHYKVK